MRDPLKPYSRAKPYATQANAGLGWHSGYRVCSNTCHATGCSTGIKSGHYFCFKHFAMLPKQIKRNLSMLPRASNDTSHYEAIREGVAAIAAIERG